MSYEELRKKFVDNGGYVEAPEIVSNDIMDIIKSMNIMITTNNYLEVESGDFIKEARGKYNLQISELLLLYFQKHFSLIVGKNLVPTYSYTRIYTRGSNLPRHSDRPACQYSITLNIGASSDDPYPFFCKSKIKETPTSKMDNPLYTPILYMGEKVSHWRDNLEKEHSTHIFLHYVDGDDPEYRPHWYDKRSFVGVDKRGK